MRWLVPWILLFATAGTSAVRAYGVGTNAVPVAPILPPSIISPIPDAAHAGFNSGAYPVTPVFIDRTKDRVVQEFSGAGSTTTGFFKVQDRWEVRWNALRAVSVAVMSADGTIVAGGAGVLRGSLYLPIGGKFYFTVTDGTVAGSASGDGDSDSSSSDSGSPTGDTSNPAPPAPPRPPVRLVPVTTIQNGMRVTTFMTPAAAAALTNRPPVAPLTNRPPIASLTNRPPITASTNDAPVFVSSNGVPVGSTNGVPVDATNSVPMEPPPPPVPPTWHLQVVELGTTVATQDLTVYAPFFVPPDSAVKPIPPPPPDPKLTVDQARSVVAIKGDNAQGNGFLLKTPDGSFVVTQLHLLSANPNLHILTADGTPITILSVKGALDRDVALFTIQDGKYNYLTLPAHLEKTAQLGDGLIIPRLLQTVTVPGYVESEDEVLLGVSGHLLGIGPDRIDFDNRIDHSYAGDPVIHAKSGKVLAMAAASKRVNLTPALVSAWNGNPVAGSATLFPHFGLRLDNVSGWETYDWPRFLQETLFLKKFHNDTRCLDSFLNGNRRRRPSTPDDDEPPDDHYFQTSDKLRAAEDTYRQLANGGDRGQRNEAALELLAELQFFVDTDVTTLQGMRRLYSYNQTRAKEELAYRRVLKRQLDNFRDNITALDNIARNK